MELPDSPASELSVKLEKGDDAREEGGDVVGRGIRARKGDGGVRESAGSGGGGGMGGKLMEKKKRRVRLGVSEVGSSRESGCVM